MIFYARPPLSARASFAASFWKGELMTSYHWEFFHRGLGIFSQISISSTLFRGEDIVGT